MSRKWILFVCTFLSGPLHGQDISHWRHDLLQWREQREKNMLYPVPRGWVSLVGLYWLQTKDISFGSAEDNQIRIKGAEPHIGVLHVEGGDVRLLAPSSGFPQQLHVDGKPAKAQILNVVGRSEAPAFLTEGSLTLVLLAASDRVGLIMDDSQSPGRLNYHGLHWYEPDPRYRVKTKWIPNPKPRSRTVYTAQGLTATLQIPGEFEFSLFGNTYRVEAALEDDKTLNFLVRDKTSARSTYGSGRYLSVPYPDRGLDKPGNLLIDLNQLRNPPCAYTAYANCPLPPPENNLPISLPVGEKKYHD